MFCKSGTFCFAAYRFKAVGLDVFLLKTFITYDMCKGEQIGNFAKSEEFRRLVHEEMRI